MTYGAFSAREFARYDLDHRSRTPIPQAFLCAAVLVLSATAGLWVLYHTPDASAPSPAASTTHQASLPASKPALPPKAQSIAHMAPAAPPIRRYAAALFDPSFTSNLKMLSFAQSAPLRSHLQPSEGQANPQAAAAKVVPPLQPASNQVAELETPEVEVPTAPQSAERAILPAAPVVSEVERVVPLPMPRPAMLSQAEEARPAQATRRPTPASLPAPVAPGVAAEPEHPSFFDKLFGGTKPSSNVLAYAAPEDGRILGTRAVVGDRQTAIYDISAHTVYLPNGARLEAHSGLGAALDDPRSVTMRMRGATPPTLYDLTLREAPFHGVRALRLTPVGDGTTYGRGGLLAHTFMLGPRGDSNGCVVFRNYQAFLAAYESGQIRRLQVVARLN